MKVGNLVKIKRATVGVPAGTLGLIIEDYSMERLDEFPDFPVYDVHMCGTPRHPINKRRRYLEVDLEVIK